jgi:DNA-binding transcriptional regulator of glucitol operon
MKKVPIWVWLLLVLIIALFVGQVIVGNDAMRDFNKAAGRNAGS